MPNQGKNKRRQYDKFRMEQLAFPKERNDKFIPDRPSPYWSDYVIDPTPLTLKGSQELSDYYSSLQSNMPRLSALSKPKSIGNEPCLDTTPKSSTGIPISALTYEPSDRIKELAKPKPSGTGDKFPQPPERKDSHSSRPRSPIPRNPRFPRKKDSTDSTKIDLGKGDFRNRSKYHIDASSSRGSTNAKASATNTKVQTATQVHVQNNVTFMHRNLVPPQKGLNVSSTRPLRTTYPHSTTAVGSSLPPGLEGLQIDRSYAASKVNISVERAGTADTNSNANTHGARVTKPKPMPMQYAPKNTGCQKPQDNNKKPPQT